MPIPSSATWSGVPRTGIVAMVRSELRLADVRGPARGGPDAPTTGARPAERVDPGPRAGTGLRTGPRPGDGLRTGRPPASSPPRAPRSDRRHRGGPPRRDRL